jgi:hypothetical protein
MPAASDSFLVLFSEQHQAPAPKGSPINRRRAGCAAQLNPTHVIPGASLAQIDDVNLSRGEQARMTEEFYDRRRVEGV